MIVEIIDGIGGPAPIRFPASQVLVCADDGTPIMIAGEYGLDGTYKVAHVGDRDFQQVLKAFGVQRHEVIVDHIESAPIPGGAKLIAGPTKDT